MEVTWFQISLTKLPFGGKCVQSPTPTPSHSTHRPHPHPPTHPNLNTDIRKETHHKFISAVHNIYQQVFPLVRVSRKRWRDKPWLTKALKISIKHENKLYKEYILRPERVCKTKYNAYKNCLLKQRKSTINYFENNKDSVFNLWKTLNPIINHRKTTLAPWLTNLCTRARRLQTSKKYQIQWIGCDIGVRLQSELPNYGNRFLECLPPRISDPFYLAPTCKDDVQLEITWRKWSWWKHLAMTPLELKLPNCAQKYLLRIYLRYLITQHHKEFIRMLWKSRISFLFLKAGQMLTPKTIGRLVCFPILIKYMKNCYAKD